MYQSYLSTWFNLLQGSSCKIDNEDKTTTFLSPIKNINTVETKPKIEIGDDVETNIEELRINKNQEQLFFESILNIESMLFIAQTTSLSSSGLSKIIESMIYPFQMSLLNIFSFDEDTKKGENIDGENDLGKIKKEFEPSSKKKLQDLLKNLSNFTKSVDIPNEPGLSKSLEMRNLFLDNDKSKIATSLYLPTLENLKNIIEETEDSQIKYLLNIENLAVKRLKFKKMFEEFIKVITQTDNISKAIINERESFLNLFIYSTEIDIVEYKKVRMIVNLGGSFILPSLLFHISEKFLHSEKEVFMNKIIVNILRPIETLKLELRHRSSNEKKHLILEFLNNCLNNNNLFSDAFNSRSSFLSSYFRDDISKISKIDLYQEIMLKKYIEFLEKLDADFFDQFICINKEIVTAYHSYLMSGSSKESDKLEEFFGEL